MGKREILKAEWEIKKRMGDLERRMEDSKKGEKNYILYK